MAFSAALGGSNTSSPIPYPQGEVNISVYGRVFECGSGKDDLRLWLFVRSGKSAECREANGTLTCTNGKGDHVEATCAEGCAALHGKAGCFALTDSKWAVFRHNLPMKPVFTLSCRNGAGKFSETIEFVLSDADLSCATTRRLPGLRGAKCEAAAGVTMDAGCSQDGAADCTHVEERGRECVPISALTSFPE